MAELDRAARVEDGECRRLDQVDGQQEEEEAEGLDALHSEAAGGEHPHHRLGAVHGERRDHQLEVEAAELGIHPDARHRELRVGVRGGVGLLVHDDGVDGEDDVDREAHQVHRAD